MPLSSKKYGPVMPVIIFAHSGTTVVLLNHFASSYLYPYPDSETTSEKLSIHPTSHIQIEFLRFQQELSVTGNAVLILLAAQDNIAKVLDGRCTDFGFNIPSFKSTSRTKKERKCVLCHHKCNLVVPFSPF